MEREKESSENNNNQIFRTFLARHLFDITIVNWNMVTQIINPDADNCTMMGYVKRRTTNSMNLE